LLKRISCYASENIDCHHNNILHISTSLFNTTYDSSLTLKLLILI
jgi:hypothetical protein